MVQTSLRFCGWSCCSSSTTALAEHEEITRAVGVHARAVLPRDETQLVSMSIASSGFMRLRNIIREKAGWSRKVESLRPCVIVTVLDITPVMHVISQGVISIPKISQWGV
eukprot:scaffold103524_cov36-Phaeocystis_antarctica.AAC.1